ncbi:hypothetical protein CANINC_001111 [Pichia inconspicua]|uniref:t-SNARE coiled-coil homology domain-containing protein n=1 Tax=Pichia inconspicua TaxID=52247 RepID=A0A4T0X662_9ASCO|nr:hypothetical protein CANINC_001111 [[Candida] inconspicua]
MGIKKLFRAKELSDEDAKNLLEKNGVTTRDENQYHRSKFKFGEFRKYSEQQAKNKDTTLRPVVPQGTTGYGYGYGDSYGEENNSNQSDSNQGLGYDEHANEYRTSTPTSASTENSYGTGNGSYRSYSDYGNGSYGYTTPNYGRSASARDQGRRTAVERRPQGMKQSASYGGLSRNFDTASIKDGSSKYGYEASMRSTTNDYYANASSSSSASVHDATHEYGFDPYSASSISVPASKSVSTFDAYTPAAAGGSASDDVYGFNVEESYNHEDDNSTLHADASVAAIGSGMQALQLEAEHKQVEQVQDNGFDPYGPAVGQVQDQETVQEGIDLNAYEPTPVYDDEEFEELDEDEEELNRIQRQTKEVRGDTVHLTRQMVDNLANANVTASNTLGVLGNQREKIYEMENNVGTMNVQTRFVDDHVKELEHYNRSLFHIKMNNPFTRSARRKAKDRAFLAQRQEDRLQKDNLNSSLYESQQAIMDQLNNGNGGVNGGKSELQEKYEYERRVREANKYLTADHDEEDERQEVEIAANLERAQKFAETLKKKAQLMSHEIGKQNKDLQNISQNVDNIDDKVVMSTRRIRGI